MAVKKQATRELNETVRVGTMALAMATQSRGDLEPRLQPGVIEHLAAYLTQVRAGSGAAATSGLGVAAATADKHVSLEDGVSLVHSIRETVKTNLAGNKVVVKAFGVGTRSATSSTASVVKALKAIVQAAVDYPNEAKLAGVLPADLDEAKAAIVALDAKTTAQTAKQLTTKQLAAAELETQLLIEDSIEKVAAAAGLVYRKEPRKLQPFLDLLPSHSSNKAHPAVTPPAKPAEVKK